MLLRHSRLFAAIALLSLSLASTAGAAVLWDQTNVNSNNEGTLNLSSNSCSQISGNTKLHTANDVTFSTPVNITTVRIYETSGNVETATQAYLWIAPKTGTLPTNSSTEVNNAANIVPITISYENGLVVVTASGLNRALAAGSYWVSLTPRHSRGLFPYTVHRVTATIVGDPSPVIEACTANSNWLYALAPNMYDYAMKIEGEIPVPAAPSSWGLIKSTYR